MKVDWFRVFADLQQQGITMCDVSNRTGIPRTTLIGFKNGSEPRHSDGELLLAIWRSEIQPGIPIKKSVGIST